ncbi:MAG: hypothetical protein OFPII_30590 [Osedax symbiont Rs1]|nr:MAG: hypothetical protein OFPII_30590 [Osedax symbiont Rs1]
MSMMKDVLLNVFANTPYFIVSTYQSLVSGLAAYHKIRSIVFTFLIVLSPLTHALHSEDLDLTAEEQHWIEKHSEVTMAYDGHFPPYSFLNDKQEIEGFAVDLFKVLAHKTGITFNVHPQYTWDDLFTTAKAHKIDVVATMVKSQDRLQWFNFTQTYVYKSHVIFSHEDDVTINDKSDLKNKTVALVRGYQYIDKILKDYPTITPMYFDTILDSLNAVTVKKADAAITFFGAGHFIRKKYLVTNLKYAASYDRDIAHERIAIRNDWPLLSSILDKALASIPEIEYQQLIAKWLPVNDIEELAVIELTQKERDWIKDHPYIRLGVDPEYAPFEYIDEHQYKGIAADYVKLLNQRLHLNMQVVDNLSWNEVIDGAKNKEIDVLPVISITPQRSQFLSFTLPYLKFYRVIVTQEDMPFISSLNDLDGKIVAVQKNTSNHDLVLQHSKLRPAIYDNLQQSLLAVSSGEADAYIGNVAAVTYWIRKLNLTNLKIAAPASTEIQEHRFAVRKDWPELTSILQKGLDSISDRQKNIISGKWLSIDYSSGNNYHLVWQITGLVGLALLAVLAWNLILNRKVKLRTSQLTYSANYDKLTDLPNRFLILDRLKQKIDETQGSGHKIVVASIDINDFKMVNSTYGHAIGDDILHRFAQRLNNSLRAGQQVGRLSGNQFLMIQSHVQDCIEFAGFTEQIIACSEKHFTVGQKKISINASLGVSLYPDDGNNAELLLTHANTATQHAKKHTSEGYVYYSERLNHKILRKLIIEKYLRRAVQNNELEVYYQPKLDPVTQKAVSFEALLRWNNEELGLVSPVEFIPIAEKHGSINEIGLFVMKQALATLAGWQKKYNFEFSIAINLSPVQFNEDDLLPNIESLLNKYELKRSTVEFEITEGVLLSKYLSVEDTLQQLERLGVSLAMDDFGTGYSSLSYLRKYRFNTLKIDQEFISELPHSSADKKLVSAIIAMAHELDMKVVAEGVETEQQHAFLIEQKCDYVQGWLYSKALNVADVKDYLDRAYLV